MPDVKPFPKPDLSKYPEIPAGACLNFNNRYGYYQVYKSLQKEDLSTGKKRQSRITYGSIGRDGFFGSCGTDYQDIQPNSTQHKEERLRSQAPDTIRRPDGS